MSNYEELSKCRGCGAGIWAPTERGAATWHIVHNEANCLANELAEESREVATLKAERDAAVSKLGELQANWDECYKDLSAETLRANEAESRLHQLSEDHSHCEDLLHELGARVSTAESRLGRALEYVKQGAALIGDQHPFYGHVSREMTAFLNESAVETHERNDGIAVVVSKGPPDDALPTGFNRVD